MKKKKVKKKPHNALDMYSTLDHLMGFSNEKNYHCTDDLDCSPVQVCFLSIFQRRKTYSEVCFVDLMFK